MVVCDQFGYYDVFMVGFMCQLWCVCYVVNGEKFFDVGVVIFVSDDMGVVDFYVQFFEVEVFYIVDDVYG